MSIVFDVPYALGDIAISTTLLPFFRNETRENIQWHVLPKYKGVLEDVITLDVIEYPIDKTPEIKADKIIRSTPWQNKSLLCNPYCYLPQIAILGRVAVTEPRPQLNVISSKWEHYYTELAFQRPYVMLETDAISCNVHFSDNEIRQIAALFPEHEIFICSKDRKLEGFRTASDIPILGLIPIYEHADVYIGVSSGISCVTTTTYKCPRFRYEVCFSKHVSTCWMEPKTRLFQTKEKLFTELAKQEWKSRS